MILLKSAQMTGQRYARETGRRWAMGVFAEAPWGARAVDRGSAAKAGRRAEKDIDVETVIAKLRDYG